MCVFVWLVSVFGWCCNVGDVYVRVCAYVGLWVCVCLFGGVGVVSEYHLDGHAVQYEGVASSR